MTTRPTVRTIARTGLTLGVIAAGVAAMSGTVAARTTGTTTTVTPAATLPATLTLTGIVRDFKGSDSPGGHVDFQRQPTAGFGHYVHQAQLFLDSDGKPVFSSTGYKVNTEATDSKGNNVMPMMPGEATSVADPMVRGARSDNARRATGRLATSLGGALTTAERFSQWYRDVPGTNVSIPVSITLRRQATSNIYSFNDRNDPLFQSRGGFFPINGEGFGNSPGGNGKNFHFTFELATKFNYRRGSGQVFTFTGDDDVFVYVDGVKVIDLGGVHGAISQTIDLDKLTWLVDGREYDLKLFFCERHYSESNMRIDTTLELRPAELPSVTNLFD